MDTTKLIKRLVIVEMLLFLLVIVFSFFREMLLPELLQEYLVDQMAARSASALLTTVFVLSGFMIAYIVSLVGLLCSKVWAKKLYAFSVVIACFIPLFFGPVVQHGVSVVLGDLLSMVTGAVLSLLFFTNSEFTNPKA